MVSTLLECVNIYSQLHSRYFLIYTSMLNRKGILFNNPTICSDEFKHEACKQNDIVIVLYRTSRHNPWNEFQQFSPIAKFGILLLQMRSRDTLR